MKQLLESIQKLKTYSNIGDWYFDDEEIYVDGQFRTGKVLTLFTSLTSHPKEFPSNEMERNLMRELGLNLIGWKMADTSTYNHHWYFKIYKLTQVERFRAHCVRRTCTNMYDEKGTIKLAFKRGRSQGDLGKFEQQVLLRLSYIKEADTDYWDLRCTIRAITDIQDGPIDVVMDLHIESEASIMDKPVSETKHWIHMPGADVNAQPEFKITPGSVKVKGIFLTNYCPDCKGTGYYQPLIGPRESCQRCQEDISL